MSEAINIIGRIRGSEQYMLIVEDGEWAAALRAIGRWAVNPELVFTWYDAAVMSERIKDLRQTIGEFR